MTAQLLQEAAKVIPNQQLLINVVSKRVRQLNSAGGTGSRALVDNTANLGAGDIALTELVEDKMDWEPIAPPPEEITAPKKRKRS